MPTPTEYSYAISSSTKNGKVVGSSLFDEILASSIVIAPKTILVDGAQVIVTMKDALSAGDQTVLDDVLGAHEGELLSSDPQPVSLDGVPTTGDNKPVFSMWPTEGTKVTSISHNWCDPTTWIHLAVRVVDEVADCANPGTYTQYDVNNSNIIDTYHGKIFNEDFLKDASDNSYRVVVQVNDVTKTEQDPHTGSGGDYTIDYALGRVTFLTALTAPDVVKVTYHYENGSCWALKPSAGKILKIKSVEVQFSEDIEITDTVTFQAYGYVDVFAPHLTPSPYPAGTLIPLGDPVVYKGMIDYINEANGAMPRIPALGGGTWRGMSQDVYVFPWDYVSLTELVSSYGMEIRIEMTHNTAFTGSVATATFYGLSVDE